MATDGLTHDPGPDVRGPMRAAVLCPGPSLHETFGPLVAERGAKGGFDVLIGVNRACVWYAVDYACIHDHDCLHLRYSPAERAALFERAPTLISDLTEMGKMLERYPQVGGLHRIHKGQIDLPDTGPQGHVGWKAYSEPLAIAAAAWLGARRICTFGNDWSGVLDTDGGQGAAPDNRNEARWRRQARIFDGLVGLLAGRGVTVERRRP